MTEGSFRGSAAIEGVADPSDCPSGATALARKEGSDVLIGRDEDVVVAAIMSRKGDSWHEMCTADAGTFSLNDAESFCLLDCNL